MLRRFKLILGLIPLFIGGVIYLIYRSDTLLMFKWSNYIGAGNAIEFLRSNDQLQSILVPNWVKYSLPDALWLFSFNFIILFLWGFKVSKDSMFWILFACSIGLSSELGQLIGIIPGTFDNMDLLLLIVSIIFSFSLISFSKQSKII